MMMIFIYSHPRHCRFLEILILHFLISIIMKITLSGTLVMWLFQFQKEGGKKSGSLGGWFGGWFGWGSKEPTPSESKSVSKYRDFATTSVMLVYLIT